MSIIAFGCTSMYQSINPYHSVISRLVLSSIYLFFFGNFFSFAFLSKQPVVLEDHGGVSAVIIGIDSSGLLKAVTEKGVMFLLQPDGNSFDMMKGLISRKK
jgi:hypothetical protein